MIVEISLIIIGIAVLVATFVLVPALIQIKQSSKKLEKTADDLNQYLPSILENVNGITTSLNDILSNGRRQVATLEEATDNIKMMVDDIVNFERRIKEQVEEPIVDTLRRITAITKAVRTFIIVLLDRK